jgi:hypothetical protein
MSRSRASRLEEALPYNGPLELALRLEDVLLEMRHALIDIDIGMASAQTRQSVQNELELYGESALGRVLPVPRVSQGDNAIAAQPGNPSVCEKVDAVNAFRPTCQS